MTTITVRISEKDKTELKKYGKISNAVREAIVLYINSKRSKEVLKRLKELHRVEKVRTTTLEEVALIKEDRSR